MITRNKLFTSVIATFAIMSSGVAFAAPVVAPDDVGTTPTMPAVQLTSRDYVDGLVSPVKRTVEEHSALLGNVIMTTTVKTVTGAVNELNNTKLDLSSLKL